MRNKYLNIINHYGINNQQRKLEEEVFELQEAITKYESGYTLTREYIKEEVADVYVLLNQIIEYYNLSIDDIDEIMTKKLNRQIERMKNECLNYGLEKE